MTLLRQLCRVSTQSALSLCAASAAMAHGPDHANIPVLRCWNLSAEVECASLWSKSYPMGNATVDVIDRNGKTINSLKTNSKGRIRFARPEGSFVLLLHDVRSTGQTFELDHRDVDATKPPR